VGSTKRSDLTSGQSSRAEARLKERIRLDTTIRGVVARHAPDLAAGNPGAGLQPSVLEKIIEEISGGGIDSDRKALRTLERALRQMQRVTKGEVRLPDPVVSLQRKASPFRPQEMARVRGFSEAIATFTSDLAKSSESDGDLPAARILFSAVAFGGLLHRTLINAFGKALEQSFAAANDTCWIDIPLKSEDGEHRVRRWFPDPVTQCLIARWRKNGCTWPAQRTPDALISTLLKHLGRTSGKRFDKSLGALVRAAIARTRLLIPGILVDFLQSVDHGQSLPFYAWWRVFADRYLDSPTPSVAESEEEIASEFDAANQPDVARTPHRKDSSEDLEAVKLLKASLKKNKGVFLGVAEAKRSIQDLRKRLGARGPMVTVLMDWSEWRLGPCARAVSVYRYLGSFANALIAAGGEVDPEKVAPTVLESVYRDVLVSMKTVKARSYAAARLRHFHVFLMINREVAPVEIDGEVTSLRSVRANIISEAEYGRTLAQIDMISDERTRAMLRAMLIIAFRTGPRRSELTHARITDLQAGLEYDSTRPLLWIHAHPDASLKTYASLRRLSLAHLMTREEREELIQWVGRRLRETSLDRPAQSLLFCELGANTVPVSDDRIDVLVELLRSVCEDDTIVFHSLRHCFSSHLFSRIFVAELQFRSSQPLACPWSRSEKEWKSLKRLFRSELLPREGAYLLSALAGHIDPNETMNSYVHLQDWISGMFLREAAATHGISLWAALEGITPEAMMVRHSRDKRRTGVAVIPHLDTPQRMLKSLHIPLPPGHPPKKQPLPPVASLPGPTHRLKQMRLEGVYSALAIASKPMNDGARRLLTGIDTALYRRLCKKASELAATQSATRNKGARRPRILAPKAKRAAPLPSRLPQIAGLGPSIPRQHHERIDAREAFRCAMESKDQKIVSNLEFLLKSTSHSDPILRLHSLAEVNCCVALLSSLGIPRRRLALEIKSVPRTLDDPKKWPKKVSIRTRFSQRELINAEDPEALPRAINRHKEGVLALHVYSDAPHKGSSKGSIRNLAYGWRVGCFYALCVLRALAADDARAPHRKPPNVPEAAKH
jgi:integrase